MKNSFLISVLLFSVLLMNAQLSTTIPTNQGQIQGIQEEDVLIFKGIPYAEPPIGDLRWSAPQPKTPWEGVLDCTSFGPSPMQAVPQAFFMWSEEFLIPKSPISEDCLYLNIWTAATSNKDKKAVIVWINGGGFTSGSGSVPIYDGTELAKKGVVYVSINYREGIFGFFAHPLLTEESPNKSSGNYGLLDQIAALKWVKAHIENFGGDPNNITIAGQSAGSISVSTLIASPLTKGLFQKAIPQSGTGILPMAPAQANVSNSIKNAELTGLKVAQELKVTSLEELRALSAQLLMNIQIRFSPNIDGYLMPASARELFKKEVNNKVALLTGWNENEGLVFGPPPSDEEFKDSLKANYGDLAEELSALYPASTKEELQASVADFARDQLFGAQNYTLAKIMASQGIPTYVYRFQRDVPAKGQYVGFKAFHTAEVPYALHTLHKVDRPWEESDRELSELMSTYWVNFAKTGNPNAASLPKWNLFDNTSKQVMYFDQYSSSKPLADAERLDFFYKNLY